MFDRLATGYHAGLDLRSLWQREAQSGRLQLARSSQIVLDEISGGATLAEAMEKTNGYFTPLTIAVVKAGESSGRLEQSFRKLAQHFESWTKFRNDTILALSWPVFQFVFAILIVGALILLMGWALSGSGMDGIDWFGWGWGTADYFRAYVTCVLGGVVAIGLFFVGLKLQWFGTLPSQIGRYIPVLSGILKNLGLARLSWALGASLGAGMNVVESLKIAFRASQDARYIQFESQVEQAIVANQSIYETLSKTKQFPEEFLTLVSNGEVSGQLPETLERVSGYYQDKVEKGLLILRTVIFVAVLLFVAAVIGTTVIVLFNKVVLGAYREAGGF